jgi:hypothetical protein
MKIIKRDGKTMFDWGKSPTLNAWRTTELPLPRVYGTAKLPIIPKAMLEFEKKRYQIYCERFFDKKTDFLTYEERMRNAVLNVMDELPPLRRRANRREKQSRADLKDLVGLFLANFQLFQDAYQAGDIRRAVFFYGSYTRAVKSSERGQHSVLVQEPASAWQPVLETIVIVLLYSYFPRREG